jgi:ABC-type Fe3+ transport system permease subunit/DNA-binding beta-propeller fold protein YncE
MAAFVDRPSSFPFPREAIVTRGIIWVVFVACCALPLAWMVWALCSSADAWRALHPFEWHMALLGRTLLYGLIVALVSMLFAWPVAMVLGKGRGVLFGFLAFVLPVALLVPSIVYTYGWVQLFWVINEILKSHGWVGPGFKWLVPVPGTVPDIGRCIWTLSTWLWPIPAGLIGLSLRRLDSDMQQQALLDGGYWRVVGRQLLAPALTGFTIVAILAMQEYAIYEPNGISVVATEVRTVFVTGEAGSMANPINSVVSTAPFGYPRTDQAHNAAAALVTATPLLLVTGLLSWLVLRLARRQETTETIDIGPRPRVLSAGWVSIALALGVITFVLIVPMVTMALSDKRSFDLVRIWRTFSPEVEGALILGTSAGLVAIGLGSLGIVHRSRWPGILGLTSFLIGGPLLAIALIRLYNRPVLGLDHWVCNGPVVAVMAYIARFGWLAMWATGSTWQNRWQSVRDMAAVDGAGDVKTAWYVVWPLAWPLIAACGVLVMLLAMTEVPATILLFPMHPKAFTPELMTWVHTLHSDDMLEGSLLLAGTVILLGGVGVLLFMLGRARRVLVTARRVAVLLLVLLLVGCDPDPKPKAIWLETGAGEGQVVYPRALCYSKADDTYYIVDRMARIQHLDHNGNFIAGWRMPAFAQGKPVGLSVGPDGNLWVPDTHYSRVMVFTPKGELLKQFGSFGREKGQFIYPSDVAFDAKGRIFVSEFGDHDRVQVFDQKFNYLFEFGHFGDGDGAFSRPQSIVIDGGTLYITDACNHRISVWTTDGRFVRNMGTIGSGLGEFRFPYGLDMDSKGRLVVCEFGNNRVQLIDKETGKGLATWGSGGREPGQLAYPWGVAVGKNDRVVAVDAGNNRLQVFDF